MKHLSFLATILLIAIAALSANGVFAFFELDERVIGTPKKTILADGRVHIKYDEVKNKPWPADIEFPKSIKLSHHNSDNDDKEEHKDHYINFHAEAIMPAHWEVFNVADHSDASKLVCHDRGDKNMRLSLFGISAKLTDYLKNKKESIILTASASQHVCHGDPIFRVVTAAHFFDNEVVLITNKASYEDIFEHADVGFDIKHPQLTHFRSDERRVFKTGNDHGVTYNKNEIHKPVFEVPTTTFGSEAVPAMKNRMHPRDLTEVDGHKANKKGNALFEAGEMESAAKGRKAQRKGWFKKISQNVIKSIKKIVTVVKSAVSPVIKAVAQGIQVVKNVLDTVQNIVGPDGNVVDSSQGWFSNIFSLTLDKKFDKSTDFTKNYKTTIKGIIVEMNLVLKAGFKFQLYIKDWSFRIFHTSVYGTLDFGASAELPRKTFTDSAQTTLWNVPVTTVTFSIGPVPVWVSYSTSCIAGYSIGAGLWAKAGFRVQANVQLGVEYTSDRGFRMINSQEFTRSHSLEYEAYFTAAPFIGAQARFALYSLITGYAQLSIGLDVVVAVGDSQCTLLKIYANFFIQLSAGLDIELKVLGKTLFSKEFGPWKIADWKWPAINVCKQRSGSRRAEAFAALPLAEQQEMLSIEAGEMKRRDASLLSDSTTPITQVTENDSGKTWNAAISCASANLKGASIDLTGFFDTNTTVYFVAITRNITTPITNESNMTYTTFFQSALAVKTGGIAIGQTYNFTLLAATRDNADDLGIDYEDIQALTKANGDNLTTALDLQWLSIGFGTSSLDQITVANPVFCPQGQSSTSASTSGNSQTTPVPPAEGSYFGRMFANFAQSLFPSFIRLITGVLVVVLILAAAEFVLAYLAPRILGEHWPKTSAAPRTREWVYMVAGICVGTLSMIIFIVGSSVTYSEITGATLAPNFTVPVANQGESSFLTASGVQTMVWKFHGASIELNACPQYYPCSPDCRDLCKKQTRSWTDAPFPYCPSDSVVTENGTCAKFAWDAVLDAIFFIGFLFIGSIVTMKKSETIYRRLICLHACFMLAGMFLNLLVRRMDSFMVEVKSTMFQADKMIIPYSLGMNADSESAWKAAIAIYWIMVGIVSVGMGYDMYLYRKDTMEGKITRFDEGFEADYNPATSSTEGKNSRLRKGTELDIAADLANINGQEASDNEKALM